MPITEIVTPSHKQDEDTRSEFEGTAFPILLKALDSAPGMKAHFIGPMLTENGINVKSAVKYALGLEWETDQNFYDVLLRPEFQDFVAKVKPLVTGFPQPQLFKTDLSPVAAFESHVTEVFRVKIGGGGNDVEVVRGAWKSFVDAVNDNQSGALSLSGTSLNLEQELFLGIIGWKGVDVRETVLSEAAVKKSKSKLESLDGVDSFTVSMAAHLG